MEEILKELDHIQKSGFGVLGYTEKDRSRLVYALSNIEFSEYMFFNSGGGFLHLFLHLKNKKIVSIHFADLNIEVSYKSWNWLDDYLERQEEETGFGFEYNFPNYQERIVGDNWTPKEFHKIFSKVFAD